MADGGFRGTNVEQDARFADKQKKLMRTLKFPASFSRKVDMKKVNLSVIKPWIVTKVTALLGFEDEVLINYIFEMLQPQQARTLDPKQLQINLTEFLDTKHTPVFVSELWDLLLSAQESIAGIPKVFLEEKMKEVAKIEADKERIVQELKRRAEASTSAATTTPIKNEEMKKTHTATERSSQKQNGDAGNNKNDKSKPDEYSDRERRHERNRDEYRERDTVSERTREEHRDRRGESNRDRREYGRSRDSDSYRSRRDYDQEPRDSRDRYQNHESHSRRDRFDDNRYDDRDSTRDSRRERKHNESGNARKRSHESLDRNEERQREKPALRENLSNEESRNKDSSRRSSDDINRDLDSGSDHDVDHKKSHKGEKKPKNSKKHKHKSSNSRHAGTSISRYES